MPKRADAGPSINVDIDVDENHIVEVLDIDEAPSQFDNSKAGDMSLTWKFRLYNQATGAAVIDLNSGDAYEMWCFTNDSTYRNKTTGQVAKAREWTEALVGRELTDAESDELIDLGFRECLKGKRGLAVIEWYTTKKGAERLKIIRLRPYKKGQPIAADPTDAPGAKTTDAVSAPAPARPAEDIAARRKRLGLDDAA